MSVVGKAWSTPLKRMKVRGGRAKITDVPILVTGVWKGTVVNEGNIDEVVAFQKKEGAIHLVADHLEDVNNWIGLAFNYSKNTNPAGYIEVLADIEITDEEVIKKLKYANENGGGFCGISPRIEWDKRDEMGNVEGLSTPHVSIVIHPAQGWTTRMSAAQVSAYIDLGGKENPPNECKCPDCGKIVKKGRGVPCQSTKCPECKTEMVGYWPKEDESMAGLGVIKMSLSDLRKNAPKLCPKCKEFTQKNVSNCPKCGEKLIDYGVVRCQSCKTVFDLEKLEGDKCPACGKSIKNLDIVIPFAAIGENEEVVIPKPMLQEIDEILKNPKVDSAAIRGFMEKFREELKIKDKEEEEEDPDEEEKEDEKEEEEDDKKKKKEDPEEGEDEAKKDKKDPEEEDDTEDEAKKKKDEDPDEDPDEDTDEEDAKKHSVYVVPTGSLAEKIKSHVYSKELLGTCLIRNPNGFGMIPIDESFLSTVVENTKTAFGGRIPVYIGHPKVGHEPADKVIGWASKMTAGRSLMARVSVTNQLVHDRIDEGTLRDGSVGLSLGWRNEQGVNIGPVITHFAITTTPLLKKLKGFKKLVASATDVETQVIEKVSGDPFGIKAIHEEIDTIKASHEKEMEEVAKKYEKLVKRDIQDRRDKIVGRVDRLIELELVKSGFRKRFEEWIEKTESIVFDERHSVPEALFDILEICLVKGDVSLTDRETEDTSSGGREYLSTADFDKFSRQVPGFIRSGTVKTDKNDRPYWVNGRPSS